MSESGSVVLERARTLGSKFFYKFGIHCATHQIRVILISCVVITSLFYPALAIYASSQTQMFSHSTSHILDAFLAPNTLPGFYLYAQHDLWNLWRGHSALRIREDAVSRARCGLERTVRVERVLIQGPFIDDDIGALDYQILLSTLQLERRISKLMASRKTPCLRRPDGPCVVLSPLSFWDHDEDVLRADPNILQTVNVGRNVTVAGITVTPQMVVAGRTASEHTATGFDSALFLALTYFFPEADCLGSTSHTSFIQVLQSATQGEELVIQGQQPILLALEYDSQPSRHKGLSAISAFLYVAYAGFFAYVTESMRRMDGVHSRVGVTFTALIEIAVSTITSLSVCALFGFNVTMVPWELLPVVIVFVGAENMFGLVDAVTKTSVTLSVKQRIAEGLSRAGTSNSLKVLSYNAILGTIAFFAAGAIRQFCAFAIVVLIAHWFLAHTFFMTVLSIDIQRLELEELLRQNASLAPAIPKARERPSAPRPLSTWEKLMVRVQSLLKGRATKNISLLLLLATTATLYYTTHSASTRVSDPNVTLPQDDLFRNRPHSDEFAHHSPAWHLWKLLNPEEDPLVHLRIESPSIVTFKPDIPTDTPAHYNRHHGRFSSRTLRPLLWFLKIVALPIAATTVALYGLLLYLLKNAELLEAQRNRSDSDLPLLAEEGSSLEDVVSFTTLPRAFATDVDFLAASEDGKIVASVGVQNELVVWRMATQSYIGINTTDVLLRVASTSSAAASLTALAVNQTGKYCAVGTGAGVVGVWVISEDSVKPLTHIWTDRNPSGVKELEFISTAPRHSPQGSPAEQSPGLVLMVIHDNGLVRKWDIGPSPSVKYLTSSRPKDVRSAKILRTHQNSMIAYTMADGSLEVVDPQNSDKYLAPDFCIQPGNPADLVTIVQACRIELNGAFRLVIGAATEAGVVSVWDGLTAECIAILDDVRGDVDTLRILPVHAKACNYCGERPLDSFLISLSIRQLVLFYTAYLSVRGRRCSCPHTRPKTRQARDMIVGRRSRTNSFSNPASSALPSSLRLRQTSLSNGSSISETADFPVSPHGVHSRRASEKESLRRQESLNIPLAMDENELSHAVGPADSPSITPPASTPRNSLWHNVTVVRMKDVMCDRGCWDVWQQKIVGIRRKPRASARNVKGPMTGTQDLYYVDGLTCATLERWELWTFDPSTSHLQISSLDLLDRRHPPRSSRATRTPEERVPRLPFTRVSPLVEGPSFVLAGFGNTVGVFRFTLE